MSVLESILSLAAIIYLMTVYHYGFKWFFIKMTHREALYGQYSAL